MKNEHNEKKARKTDIKEITIELNTENNEHQTTKKEGQKERQNRTPSLFLKNNYLFI